MKNNSIALLLSVNKCAMQDLHSVLGLDFCKPFDVFTIRGKYTVKQIQKEAERRNYNLSSSVVAVCTRDRAKEKYGWSCNFHLVEIKQSGNIENEYRLPYRSNYKNGLDTFYKKGLFDETRKSADAETVIFIQDKKYIKVPQKKENDYSKRFHLEGFNYLYTSEGKYIKDVTIKELDSNGRVFTRQLIGQVYYSGYKGYCKTIEEVIDKSGYFVDERRNNLKRRAAALKAEREKAKYRTVDNSAQLEELKTLIQARKLAIIEELKKAETSLELRNIEKMLAYFRGFSGIVADYETFKEKTENKQYSSIEASDRIYNNIKERLTRELTT